MSYKIFRLVHSRYQTLGDFDVDRFSIFLRSIERNFLFICQTQSFLKRLCERNIFEGFRENRRVEVTRTKS